MGGARADGPALYRPADRARLPLLARVRQRFDTSRLEDVRRSIREGVAAHGGPLGPGMRVAITAGSRGIAGIDGILRSVVDEVRGRGAEPFVVTAMGSHGGGTAEGQRAVLQGYGITEESVGCPIVSSMETVHLGDTETGFAVYLDRAAYGADAIVLVNRVKPHSMLTGDLGSGLMKMAGIGLGKREGADSIHRQGLAEHFLSAARLVLRRAPVVLGVAVVENALDQTWTVEVVPVAEIEAADRRLLREARALLPNIPFDPIDVLVVDAIGKNISGAGMDPNVIGMHRRIGGPPEREIRCIVALSLTPQSHGNACGVGMADIITARLRDAIDWHATYLNAVTSNFLAGIKLPIACPSARDAMTLAMRPFAPETVRAVRIADTAHLEEMWISPALLAEIGSYPGMEQVGEPEEMTFEEEQAAESGSG